MGVRSYFSKCQLPLRLVLLLKTWVGLPMPGGLCHVGFIFAATLLGHLAFGTGSCSPGPVIRVPRRLGSISDLIALDYKLLHSFSRNQLLD